MKKRLIPLMLAAALLLALATFPISVPALAADPTGDLLFSFAAIADPHLDAGIQQWTPPMRAGITTTVNRIKQEENADLLIVAGDMTSAHLGGSWGSGTTKLERFQTVQNTMIETAQSATQSGRVLYATGNHDFAVGLAAFNSGDYIDAIENKLGPLTAASSVDDVAANAYFQSGLTSERHVLAYHYNVGGLDFITIDTPYTGAENHGDYYYNLDSLTWVDNKLNSIGNKTVFIIAHYPLQTSKNQSNRINLNDATHNKMKSILDKYPSSIYLYGHDHGGPFIKADTYERVSTYNAAGVRVDDRPSQPSGFVSSFVGSMSYYNAPIIPSALGSATPNIVQALMVYVYIDRIVLQTKNYGVANGGVEEPEPYVINRDMSYLAAADPVFTGNEWNTNLTYLVNREDPHANFIAYDSEVEALKNFTLYQSESPYYDSLNGDWKFHWSVNPAGRATEESQPGFTTLGFNDAGWDTMRVPHSWQVSWDLDAPQKGYFKYDSIAYTNINYPWRGYGNNTASGGSAAANQDHQIGQAPKVYNSVGTYRRHFTIDPRWKAENRSVTLRFEGVESNCYVWVNGRAVGYAEDSFTTKDFDITDYVDYDGDNVITVQIFRWSSGSFYEDQDFIRTSGIVRDVYLVGRSKVTLYDVDIITTPVTANVYGDDWNLNVISYLRSLEGATQTERDASHVEYKLYDGDTAIASFDSDLLTFANVPANIIGDVNNRGKIASHEYLGAQVNHTFTVEKPRQWSAEHPNLYKLVVTLKQGEKLIETTCFRVGFRESRIINAGTANTRWTVNGSRILFYGTNTHETNPETGRYLGGDDLTLLKKDLEIMKTNNVNAIRMSHYPHDRRYYDLADEYGLYIMEETNMENHDNNQLQSNNTYAAAWGPSLRDRQNNAIERTKNYTCVISFSMGNENNSAGTTWAAWNTTWALDRLRTRGDLRPVHAQFRNGEADIQSAMYTVASSWRSTSSATATKPTLLCEYVHAMGNSNGNWDEYIQVFDDMPKTNGGFIWDWVDQSIYTPVPGNPTERYLAYGGKWEDRSGGFWGNGINDGNFCANGMILADRTPKPQVAQMKHVYRMITATGVSASTFRINNKFLFTNTSEYDQSWTLTENGQVIQSGVGSWSVGPAPTGVSTATITSADFPVPYETPEVIKPGAEYAFNIYFKTKTDAPWAKAGHVVSESQIPVTDFALPGDKAALATGAMEVVDGDSAVDVEGEDFSLSISKTSGAITKYQFKDVDLLANGPIPSFWRGPNDNEYGASSTLNALNTWRTVGTTRTTTGITVGSKGLFVKVTVTGVLTGKSNAPYTTIYTVYPSGEVDVNYRYQFPTLSSNQYAHEIGSTMTVKGEFGNLTWFGPRGETYSDRKTGGYSSVNQSTVADQYFPYIMNQETGYHVDTRWFALTNDDGFGFVIRPTAGSAIPTAQAGTGRQGMLQFNALYATPEGLASNSEGAAATRYRLPYQVRWNDDITLRVNYVSTGIGGDNSWGALPLTTYRVNASAQTYNYGFSILPVENFTVGAAMDYAQSDFTVAVNLQDLTDDCERDWPGLAYLANDLAAAHAGLANPGNSQETLADLYDALLAKYSEPRILPAPGQASSLVVRKNMITQIKVAANVGFTYTSSNPAVVTVTQTGVITGKSIGVAVIQIKDPVSGTAYNIVVNCTN